MHSDKAEADPGSPTGNGGQGTSSLEVALGSTLGSTFGSAKLGVLPAIPSPKFEKAPQLPALPQHWLSQDDSDADTDASSPRKPTPSTKEEAAAAAAVLWNTSELEEFRPDSPISLADTATEPATDASTATMSKSKKASSKKSLRGGLPNIPIGGLPFKIFLYMAFVWGQLAHVNLTASYKLHFSIRDVLYSGVVPVSLRETSKTSQIWPLKDVQSFGDALVWMDRTMLPYMWAEDTGAIQRFNTMIGGLRILQWRGKEGPCSGPETFVPLYENYLSVQANASCYAEDAAADEIPGSYSQDTPLIVQGHTANAKDAYVYWLYANGTKAETHAHIQGWRDNDWITSATRRLAVQGAFYCGQVGMYLFIDVGFDKILPGSVVPLITVKALPAAVYSRIYVLVLDALLFLLLVMLMIGEILVFVQAFRKGKCRRHLMNFTTLLNLSVVLLGFAFSAFWLSMHSMLNALGDRVAEVTHARSLDLAPADFHARLSGVYDDVTRIADMVLWCEPANFWYLLLLLAMFLKNFEASPRLAVVTSTMYKASSDLIHFLIIFSLVFLTFTLCAHFVFGKQLHQWSQVNLAATSGFRALMGDFEFTDIYAIAPVSATFWFWSFMILVYLVMINMLLAIVMEAYIKVKDEATRTQTIIEIVMGKLESLAPSVAVKSRQFASRFIAGAPTAAEGEEKGAAAAAQEPAPETKVKGPAQEAEAQQQLERMVELLRADIRSAMTSMDDEMRNMIAEASVAGSGSKEASKEVPADPAGRADQEEDAVPEIPLGTVG